VKINLSRNRTLSLLHTLGGSESWGPDRKVDYSIPLAFPVKTHLFPSIYVDKHQRYELKSEKDVRHAIGFELRKKAFLASTQPGDRFW